MPDFGRAANQSVMTLAVDTSIKIQTTNKRVFGTVPDNRRLVVIQRNPTSGSGGGARQLLILIRELRSFGFRVRLFASREHLDQFLQSPDERAKIRCIVAAGGDGTVGSVVNRHGDIPIATLPLGTENLLARHLQIPRCGSFVARLIKDGAMQSFDVGTVNGQQFLLMLSVGVDAEVVRRLHASRRGNIRHSSYIRPIFDSFCSYGFALISVYSTSGELLGTGTHVIVSNVPQYGFRMPFSPNADPHDGLLDVRILKCSGRLKTLWHAVRTRLGWTDRSAELIRFTADRIQIRSDDADAPSQLDGDPGPICPLVAAINPNAMTLLVPRPSL